MGFQKDRLSIVFYKVKKRSVKNKSKTKLYIKIFFQLVDRILCCGSDGSVRLISPLDGTILTTMLPPCDCSKSNVSSRIVDAVYCLPLEAVYAVYTDGKVYRASMLRSPADVELLVEFDGGYKTHY